MRRKQLRRTSRKLYVITCLLHACWNRKVLNGYTVLYIQYTYVPWPKYVWGGGGRGLIFSVFYSTLLYLPPLRFHCVGSNPGQLRLWHLLPPDALTTRLDLMDETLWELPGPPIISKLTVTVSIPGHKACSQRTSIQKIHVSEYTVFRFLYSVLFPRKRNKVSFNLRPCGRSKQG